MRFHVVDDDGIVITMIAPTKNDVPTEILPGPRAGGMDKYAQELVDGLNADVAAIASRMGSYSTRLEVDDDVTKSISKITTGQSGASVGYVLVDKETGLLAEYVGVAPSMGFEEGKSFSHWQEEQSGLVLEEVQE